MALLLIFSIFLYSIIIPHSILKTVKAPYSIEYKYRKIQKELKKNTLDELGWIDEIEMT